MLREELKRLTLDFTGAFNQDDLDRVMSFIADDAVYDQFNGECAEGFEAIRKAFVPQFAGAYGVMRFLPEDLILDEGARSAMISWTCALDDGDRYGGWRGLDALFFNTAGKIIRKETYAKTAKPLMRRLDR